MHLLALLLFEGSVNVSTYRVSNKDTVDDF